MAEAGMTRERLELLDQIDEICDEFEAAWQSGDPPSMKDFLTKVGVEDRETLRKELAAVETEYVRKRESAASPVGPTFGDYRVEQIISEGRFGQVYLGTDLTLSRSVVIKVLPPRRSDYPGAASGLEDGMHECRIAATLDHPHIVSVYDVGETAPGRFYVVSQAIPGQDLAKRLTSGDLELSRAVTVVAQIAEALHFAHERGLVHRDIQPAKILLDESGSPHIADFGLACDRDSTATVAAFAGTPAYMSPEQVRPSGRPVDRRSDVFSLGVVLYELLTGIRPFAGPTIEDVICAVTSFEPPAPSELDASIPPELDRICSRAIAKSVDDRYPTAHELAGDLRAFLENAARPARSWWRRLLRPVFPQR